MDSRWTLGKQLGATFLAQSLRQVVDIGPMSRVNHVNNLAQFTSESIMDSPFLLFPMLFVYLIKKSGGRYTGANE